MKKRYETVFILTPVLSDEQAKETARSYKKLLEEHGAKIIWEEDWGLKKLAYQIKKKSHGFYYLFEWEYDGKDNLVDFLELNFRRDERVLRYLTVLLDKHGIEYNEKRRQLKMQQTKEIEQ